jgi:hypothetical protein
MQDGGGAYLLHGIECTKPRAFRIMTQAQMVESAMLHGAKALDSNQTLSITWARVFLHALLYIGDLSGTFHYPSLRSLYMAWRVSPPRGSSKVYFKAVVRALADGDSSIG